MENTALINRIDKSVLNLLDQLTEPYKDQHDIKVFKGVLSRSASPDEKTTFKLRIGSKRRLSTQAPNETVPELFYNEFKVQISVSAHSFHMNTFLFHNDTNSTEGLNYHVDKESNSGMAEDTWVLPEGQNGRKPIQLFNEIIQLFKLNREMAVISELHPSQEVIRINKRFEKFIRTASEQEINWALNHELEQSEKVRVLQFLAAERKLQILSNLKIWKQQ